MDPSFYAKSGHIIKTEEESIEESVYHWSYTYHFVRKSDKYQYECCHL